MPILEVKLSFIFIMVKVFLCESAITCLEQLKVLCNSLEKVCILVPNPTYKENCIEHCHLQTPILTPSQWMELLNLRPLKYEESLFFNTYDPFDDPAIIDTNLLQNYPENFQQDWLNWLKENNIHPFSDVALINKKTLPFDNAILYGHFKTNIHKPLLQNLQNLNCYQILHISEDSSHKNTENKSIEASAYFQSFEVKSIADERLFIQRFLKENTNAVCVQPPGQTYKPLFSKTTDNLIKTWLDWQEQGNLSHFLIYLKHNLGNDLKLFQQTKTKFEKAFSICLTDHFNLLQSYLLQQGKENDWLKNFKCGNWPKEAPFTDFIQILQEIIPHHFQNFFIKLPSFPFSTTKEQFFTYLHRFITHQNFNLKQIKHLEEVLYFPFQSYLIPHCVHTKKENLNHQILSFIRSTLSEEKNVTVCSSQIGNNKEVLQPLFQSKKFFKISSSNQKIWQPKTNLALPTKSLQQLSCKNWERFYLCPLQTWLESILKTEKIPLHTFRIKTKIIGEWVHQNLQFNQKPNSLKIWLQHIHKTATVRWEQLQSIFEKQQNIPQIIKNWHQKSLLFAQQMATACQDLLSCELYSEWSLPQDTLYKGRIDLLAIQGDTAIVVDYKTALHYLFTPKQINKGHGLQLWLYGSYLKSIGKSVQLRTIDRFGKPIQIDFDQTKPEVIDIENWLNSIQSSGIYKNLPEEKEESLPLCM